VAVAEWLRHKVLSLEIAGLNSSYSVAFFQHFLHNFTPVVTILLEYLYPTIHTYFVFLLYNSLAEILLVF